MKLGCWRCWGRVPPSPPVGVFLPLKGLIPKWLGAKVSPLIGVILACNYLYSDGLGGKVSPLFFLVIAGFCRDLVVAPFGLRIGGEGLRGVARGSGGRWVFGAS